MPISKRIAAEGQYGGSRLFDTLEDAFIYADTHHEIQKITWIDQDTNKTLEMRRDGYGGWMFHSTRIAEQEIQESRDAQHHNVFDHAEKNDHQHLLRQDRF